MKTIAKTSTILALILAVVMAIGLTACSTSTAGTGDTVTGIEATGTLPDNNGLPTGDKVSTKTDPAKTLVKYGEIETLVKSVKTPTEPDTKNTSISNSYGTVDWSTAAQGYIIFTAKGQERELILQGPNGAQALATVAKDNTVKIALTDGTGKYQYAIANLTNNGKNYSVQYKNSFTVKTIDTDLAPYLVSTAWGDYENAPNAVAKAKEIWDNSKTQFENVQALTKWVHALKYDKKLKLGTIDKYVNPDTVIENGGGVCNEMSKLLVAMLRSQGVPAYYQSGTGKGGNHAWVRAWVELSTATKDGRTTSNGAWVNIEATGGRIIKLSVYEADGYSTETNNYAN